MASRQICDSDLSMTLQDYYERMMDGTRQEVQGWYEGVIIHGSDQSRGFTCTAATLTLSEQGREVLQILSEQNVMSSKILVDRMIQADKEWYSKLLGHSAFSHDERIGTEMTADDPGLGLILGPDPKADRVIALFGVLAVAISELGTKTPKTLKALQKSVQKTDQRLIQALDGKTLQEVETYCDEKLRPVLKEWLSSISTIASDVMSTGVI